MMAFARRLLWTALYRTPVVTRRRHEDGFTLPEVVVTLAVIGLIVALGVEGLGGMVARAQGRAAATEVAGELRAARSYATARRETVRVMFEMDRAIVRTELLEPPGRVLRELDLKERNVVLENLSAGSAVLFYPTGRTATPTTITLKNRRDERWRLTVTITGRVTIQ